MAFDDEVRTTQIAYLGIVCAIATLVVVMVLQVLYFQRYNALKRAELAAQRPPAELTELTSRQQSVLTRRDLLDRERGLATIGISHAMDLVVAELAAGKSPSAVRGPRGTDPADAASVTESSAVESSTSDDVPESSAVESSAVESPAAEPSTSDDVPESSAVESPAAEPSTSDEAPESSAVESPAAEPSTSDEAPESSAVESSGVKASEAESSTSDDAPESPAGKGDEIRLQAAGGLESGVGE